MPVALNGGNATKRKTGGDPELKVVNLHAAAIDIGSAMHMAAVNPRTDAMQVRAFGTSTLDQHDLAARLRSCGFSGAAPQS